MADVGMAADGRNTDPPGLEVPPQSAQLQQRVTTIRISHFYSGV